MQNFTYTAFVQLGSTSEIDRITIDVTIELQDDEVAKLNALKASYEGKTDQISKTVKAQFGSLHHKLMKGAHDDVLYLLTQNAVDNRYTEVFEEDLFADDCDEGRFTPSDDEDDDTAFSRWKEAEQAKLEAMSRVDRTAYITERYLIELDFDENDYDYYF